jgi:hypothetical protein
MLSVRFLRSCVELINFFQCATSKGLVASPALRVFLKGGEELTFSSTNVNPILPKYVLS